jgi:hypothetical protein
VFAMLGLHYAAAVLLAIGAIFGVAALVGPKYDG